MPLTLWTNAVFWPTTESPVLNAGTTNAQWLCYAKNCAGNATQTVEASQPQTITTNGVKALLFDGGDFLKTDLVSSNFNSAWTIAAWIRHSGGNVSVPRLIFHKAGTSGGQDRGSLAISGTNVFMSVAISTLVSTNRITVASGELAFVCVTYNRTGPVVGHYKNGNVVFIGTPDNPVSTTTGEGKSAIGCFNQDSPNNHYVGEMLQPPFVFNRALSTNEVLQLYNATKGRYGL
jgi:hypothetical protein